MIVLLFDFKYLIFYATLPFSYWFFREHRHRKIIFDKLEFLNLSGTLIFL